MFSAITLGTVQGNRILAGVLQVFKMFGIGVIAATAWCHLLTDAYTQFSNPCLTPAWAGYGVNFVGVFALIAAFTVQLIELFAVGHRPRTVIRCENVNDEHADAVDSAAVQVNDAQDAPERKELSVAKAFPAGHGQDVQLEGHFHEDGSSMSTIILECSILFHSLIIGVTLGVTADTRSFQTLLVAICFHQLFEGMALGSLIANLKHGTLFKYLVLGLVYPLGTPIGIVFGIGVHSSFNDNSDTVILFQGIMDSLAAGVLIYNTYAELISVEINHNKSFRSFSRRFKCVNMTAMYLGAAAMAVLANWA
ncbi:hypothetical protein PBRA_004568 [Plasmodiophora brassicae]|nr:hypothetical protein PBRA_004568 [Plasmodiophora brassicae]